MDIFHPHSLVTDLSGSFQTAQRVNEGHEKVRAALSGLSRQRGATLRAYRSGGRVTSDNYACALAFLRGSRTVHDAPSAFQASGQAPSA